MKLNETQLSSVANNRKILKVLDVVAKNSLDYPVSYASEMFTFSTYESLGNKDLTAVVKSKFCDYSVMNIDFMNTTVTNSNHINKVSSSDMAEIFIPKTVLSDQNISLARMVVYAFKNDRVFPYNDDGEILQSGNSVTVKNDDKSRIKQKVSSIIMATSIFNRTVKNTRENIEITFKLKSMVEAKNALCMYWEYDEGKIT